MFASSSSALYDNIDIGPFIREIKEYPEIWNHTSTVYNDKNKRRSAWTNICRMFIAGFDEKGDYEKNEICNLLIKKWKNIKDCYRKSTKKRSKSGSGTYVYSKQLSFLAEAFVRPEVEYGSCCAQEQLECTIAEAEHAAAETWPTRIDATNRKCRLLDLEVWPMDSTNPADCGQTGPFTDPNPDRLFFESIIPMLTEFTESERLEFRLKVLTTVKRIKERRQSPENSESRPNDSS